MSATGTQRSGCGRMGMSGHKSRIERAGEAREPLRQKRVEIFDANKLFRQGDQDVVAVRDMSFTIYDQEFISIIGPFCRGQATNIQSIPGRKLPAAGTVRLAGEHGTAPPYNAE